MTTQYFFIQKFILCVTKSFCIKILVQSCTSLQYIAYSTNSFSCNQILQSASNWLNKIFGKPKNLVPLSLTSPLLNPLSPPSTPYQPLWSADRIPLLWSDPHNTMAGLATRGLHSRQPTKIWIFADFHSKIYIFHRAFFGNIAHSLFSYDKQMNTYSYFIVINKWSFPARIFFFRTNSNCPKSRSLV